MLRNVKDIRNVEAVKSFGMLPNDPNAPNAVKLDFARIFQSCVTNHMLENVRVIRNGKGAPYMHPQMYSGSFGEYIN